MRIVQVLTYVSEDGAYGGPVAVARVQCEGLADRGHDVHLVAGWDGRAELEVPGVVTHLHKVSAVPRLGFAGFCAPSMPRQLTNLARTADVIHLHYARDMVQVPAGALVRGRERVVLQAHGMVRPDSRYSARALDRLAVRPLYRRAKSHLTLTEDEERDLPVVAGMPVPYTRVRNAVELPASRVQWQAVRPRVLYCSRLHERKRPVAFVHMAADLLRQGVEAEFVLHGADEGQGSSVARAIQELGIGEHVTYRGPLKPEDVLEQLLAAQVFVLPSVEEPFPMALLEAMAAGLPSVITDRTGLSEELSKRGSATVTDGSPSRLADAVRALLHDESTWTRASTAARADIAANFNRAALIDQLETVYGGQL